MTSSHKEIAKNSGIIGLVHIIKIIFGLIQNKVLAILVGPIGFGIWGMYNTFIEMISTFSTLGLDQSGVRQIAKDSDNTLSTSKCIWIFRRAILIISIIATLLSICFAKIISKSLFQTDQYYWGVIIISFVILFNGISKGNIAILNGLRHIKYLSISQIWGAILGAMAAILAITVYGRKGIPLFLVVTGLTIAFTTWWYVRKLRLTETKPSFREAKHILKSLLIIGIGFSISGAIYTFTTYLSRLYLITQFDIGAVGIYQSSWTISNLYIGTILMAMGVDFMPRLMKTIQDPMTARQMISEQLEFGILFSSIGVLAILVFSPLVLHIFYSPEFIVGTPIIRWQVLGVAMRVIGFVFGYVIMAYNKVWMYIVAQFIVYILDYLLLILFSKLMGFNGLGVNYFISYIVYILITILFCRKIINFRFSKSTIYMILMEWVFICIIGLLILFTSTYTVYIFGTLCIGIYLIWMNYAMKKYMKLDLISFIKSKLHGKQVS